MSLENNRRSKFIKFKLPVVQSNFVSLSTFPHLPQVSYGSKTRWIYMSLISPPDGRHLEGNLHNLKK